MSFPKLVIVEGADRTGKTTLARFLARKSGGVYLHQTHLGPSHNGSNCFRYHKNVMENVMSNIQHFDRTFILDRLWPSESIYGSVMKRDLTGYDYEYMHDMVMQCGGSYVFCHSDEAYEKVQIENKGDYTGEQFREILMAYHNFSAHYPEVTTLFKYHLESRGHDLDAVYEFLKGVHS